MEVQEYVQFYIVYKMHKGRLITVEMCSSFVLRTYIMNNNEYIMLRASFANNVTDLLCEIVGVKLQTSK